jgi:hypothetical protein
VAVKRTITGRATGRTMTLGDLRKFLASIDGIGDEAPVKARVTLRKHLRAVTIEDDDPGLKDYLRSIGLDEDPESKDGD